ncbi:Nitrogen regulation protein NR(I) [invertebrate metagenome]|uniref:DNA-binding transcriptional regulator NtrC n=1 Tax=invertebrate metagenome TaxID=1711999 RepID=A0A2H9TBF6_9ZZZZ
MNAAPLVWIIDDDRSIRWVLEKALHNEGITTRLFDQADLALTQLTRSEAGKKQPAVIISDIRMPGLDGLDFLQQVHQFCPGLPVIIMTAHSDLDSAVNAYKKGAFDYLPKPFDIDDAVHLVKRGAAHYSRKTVPETPEACHHADIIGHAPAMQEIFRAIGRLAQSTMTVLINGESGTGKELVAHALHTNSPRKHKPFIALNMAAIPEELVESELFGHEKGAFTGANNKQLGRFEQAQGGTLFLDEIGDMPARAQTRLLRVLSNGDYFRIGGSQAIKADVRIIAATHQNLEQQVKKGSFREDLFHRLNVIRLCLPRLRERREDIPSLARFFLEKIAREIAIKPRYLNKKTERYLSSLPWPGNVRQLENTCRWLSVMTNSREILISDLPNELRQVPDASRQETDWTKALQHWAKRELSAGRTPILNKAQPAFEQAMIRAALQHCAGKRQEAAKLLGWGRNTLTRKIQGMEPGFCHTE